MLIVLCPEVLLQYHQGRPFLPREEDGVVLDPRIFDGPYCPLLLQLPRYLEEVPYGSLGHPCADLQLLPSLGHEAPAVMRLDERGCRLDELGALLEQGLQHVLSGHLQEDALLAKLVIERVVDKRVGHKSHGDVLTVIGGEPPVADRDEVADFVLEDAVLEVKLGVGLANVVALLAHLDGVEDAEVLDLVEADRVDEEEGLFVLVGLYASDEVQLGVGRHLRNQLLHLLADLHPQKLLVRLALQRLQPVLEGLAEDVQPRLGQLADDVFPDEVLVLIAESLGQVLDVSGGVPDDEGLAEVDVVGGREVVVLLVVLAHVGEEVVVADVEGAALVEEVEDALVEGVEEVDDLGVVREGQLGDDALEALLLEGVLLVDEDLLQVNLVDLLVGVVHAQLLETVVLEHLEAVDVQQLHLPHLLLACAAHVQPPVQLFDQPLEKTLVDRLGHRVSSLAALPLSQSAEHQLAGDGPSIGHEGLVELLPLNAQQMGDALGHFGIPYLARLILAVSRGVEGEVADEEDGRDHGPNFVNDLLLEVEGNQGLIEFFPHLAVINAEVLVDHSFLREIVEVLLPIGVAGRGLHAIEGAMVLRQVVDELVEDVEVAFAWALADDPALLEEVVLDGGVVDAHCLRVEAQADQLAEPAGIVVLYGLRVAEHLEDRVALEDAALHVCCLLLPHAHHPAAAVTDCPQGLLVCLRLARPRLSANADHLRPFRALEAVEDLKHEGEDVRLVLSDVFSLYKDILEVSGKALLRVLFGNEAKGIDDDEAVPEACVDFVLPESSLELHEHLGSIDDVHLDQIALNAVALPAAL